MATFITRQRDYSSGSLGLTGQFTVACHVRWDDFTNFPTPIRLSDVSDSQAGVNLDLQPQADGTLELYGPNGIIGPSAVSQDVWYFVAFTRDASNVLRIYLRASEVSGAVVAGSSNTSTAAFVNLHVGTSSFGETFQGDMRGLRIWNSALDATQLEAEANSFAPVYTTGLVRNYPLSTAATLTDDTSANNADLVFAAGSGALVDSTDPTLPSSGNTYNETLTDALAAVDAASTVQAMFSVATDVLVAGDVAVHIQQATSTVTDTLVTSDVSAATRSTPFTVTDALVATDSIEYLVGKIELLTDVLASSDSVVARALMVEALSDAASLGDSLVASVLLSHTVTDTIIASDEAAAGRALLETVTDTAITTDSVFAQRSFVEAMLDTLSALDVFESQMAMMEVRSDLLRVIDSLEGAYTDFAEAARPPPRVPLVRRLAKATPNLSGVRPDPAISLPKFTRLKKI